MNNKELEKLAFVPLKQHSNRVWRTYQGGALIDRWKKESDESDGSFPEEWIMSTVTARGKVRPVDEGLSVVETPDGDVLLVDLISSNKTLFLGQRLADRYGTTGVLIKMLDSKERLTIQVHPDKQYARDILNSEFGKTESWYVLDTREVDGEPAVVYMGFKEGVTKEHWRNLFVDQNIEGMLDCLHKIEVKAGDSFMIYGGVPHAIGRGCFLMEVQEPTDYTMRVEKVTPAGLAISDELIHQGVGEDKMLDCFHYDNYSLQSAMDRWKISPTVIDESNQYRLRSIFSPIHTDCFSLKELELNGSYTLEGNGDFFVAVIYKGRGSIKCASHIQIYHQGDEFFLSAAIEKITFESDEDSKVLLCYPPS